MLGTGPPASWLGRLLLSAQRLAQQAGEELKAPLLQARMGQEWQQAADLG